VLLSSEDIIWNYFAVHAQRTGFNRLENTSPGCAAPIRRRDGIVDTFAVRRYSSRRKAREVLEKFISLPSS
jgi:hypothetical protein